MEFITEDEFNSKLVKAYEIAWELLSPIEKEGK